MGNTDVRLLEGGIETAIDQGFTTHKEGEKPAEDLILDGIYPINIENSEVGWLGRNLLNKHWGTIGIKSGSLSFVQGGLESAQIILDMYDLKCEDLEGSAMHDVLIDHLLSDDFFDVENFKEASFTISQSQVLAEAKGSNNLQVSGDLELKGTSHPVEITMSSGIHEGKAAAQGSFSIDRTKWGMIYGSGKFFKRLAGHLVNDQIELSFKILSKELN